LLTKRKLKLKLLPLVEEVKRKQMMDGIQRLICQRCQWLNKCNGKKSLTKRKLKPKLLPLHPLVEELLQLTMAGIQMLMLEQCQWLIK